MKPEICVFSRRIKLHRENLGASLSFEKKRHGLTVFGKIYFHHQSLETSHIGRIIMMIIKLYSISGNLADN
jgi:hypothetical protein